jgi:hypothetical protein
MVLEDVNVVGESCELIRFEKVDMKLAFLVLSIATRDVSPN